MYKLVSCILKHSLNVYIPDEMLLEIFSPKK
jgi:hypothetical protein